MNKPTMNKRKYCMITGIVTELTKFQGKIVTKRSLLC